MTLGRTKTQASYLEQRLQEDVSRAKKGVEEAEKQSQNRELEMKEYKEIALPFGIQSTQVHLNYWNEDDFLKFEKFIINNHLKIISFDEALEKVNKNILYLSINWLTKTSLKLIRKFKS